MANYNTYFKNNFNLLVMNVTNKLSLLTKRAFIAFNENRTLIFHKILFYLLQ